MRVWPAGRPPSPRSEAGHPVTIPVQLARRAPNRIDTLRPRNQNTRLVFPGGVPKRSTGADCKSAGLRLRRFESFPHHHGEVHEPEKSVERAGGFRAVSGSCRARRHQGGCSSMVEPQPSKLMAWVRFPSPAPSTMSAEVAVGDFSQLDESADVAQLVEHVLGKDEVTGSIPVVSSI